jgi:hypothetical protein
MLHHVSYLHMEHECAGIIWDFIFCQYHWLSLYSPHPKLTIPPYRRHGYWPLI